MSEQAEYLRMLEALLFSAAEPLDLRSLTARLPDDADVPALIEELKSVYSGRGVELVLVASKWAFRTATDLAFLMEREKTVIRRLSKAAIETLAIIGYHQPVTRAEVEEIRGVSMSRGTFDMLMESDWVRVRGRRRSPGRPVTYGTTDEFLNHFNLEVIGDLPGIEELKRTGLLQSVPPMEQSIAPAVEAEEESESADFLGGEEEPIQAIEPDDEIGEARPDVGGAAKVSEEVASDDVDPTAEEVKSAEFSLREVVSNTENDEDASSPIGGTPASRIEVEEPPGMERHTVAAIASEAGE